MSSITEPTQPVSKSVLVQDSEKKPHSQKIKHLYQDFIQDFEKLSRHGFSRFFIPSALKNSIHHALNLLPRLIEKKIQIHEFEELKLSLSHLHEGFTRLRQFKPFRLIFSSLMMKKLKSLTILMHEVDHRLMINKSKKYSAKAHSKPRGLFFKQSIEVNLNSLFSPDWYLAQAHAPKIHKGKTWDHYQTTGWKQGLRPNPFFDPIWYAKEYPDCLKMEEEPLLHYALHGWKSGARPSQDLDLSHLSPCRFFSETPLAQYLRIRQTFKGFSHKLYRFSFIESSPVHERIRLDHSIATTSKKLSLCILLQSRETNQIRLWIDQIKSISIQVTILVIMTNRDAIFDAPIFADKDSNIQVLTRQHHEDLNNYQSIIYYQDIIQKHDLFLSIHDRTPPVSSPGSWLLFNHYHLIGTKNILEHVIQLFHEDPTIGMTFAPYQSDIPEISQEELHTLCNIFPNCPINPLHPHAGHFCIRTTLLTPFFEHASEIKSYPPALLDKLIGQLPSFGNQRSHIFQIDIGFDLPHELLSGRDIQNVLDNIIQRNRKIETFEANQLKIAVCRSSPVCIEHLVPQLHYRQDIDYYLYTQSSQDVDHPFYRTLDIPHKFQNPRKSARYLKTHLHELLSEYEYVIWLDANIFFAGNLMEYIQKMITSEADAGFIRHPARCRWDAEVQECLRMNKEDPEILQIQSEKYKQYPGLDQYPLMETGFMILNLKSKRTQEFCSHWWDELNQFSLRDQISLPFAASMTKLKWISLLPQGFNVRNHPEFALVPHLKCKRITHLIYEMKEFYFSE